MTRPWNRHQEQLFIDGVWVDPGSDSRIEVRNPADDSVIARIADGGLDDVELAVAAARRALAAWSASSRDERLGILHRMADAYERRIPDLGAAVMAEMGAPKRLAYGSQAEIGLIHIRDTIATLESFIFESTERNTTIRREPIGVCALITPWNWPLHQIMCKVGPALATGCTMVLKPSELAPLDAVIFAEVLEEAGVPAGVFNLLQGTGVRVGQALAAHPSVDLVSFTGSTRGGVAVAAAAAPTVKRVTQELGGKSPNLILEDADFERSVRDGVAFCYINSGQSCDAATRMLVPADRVDEAARIAADEARTFVTGDPAAEGTQLGPLVSRAQWERVQRLIEAGVDEGAELVEGGLGRPDGLENGWYARPTVFANVRNQMTIARTEIFGPVLSIIGYRTQEEAVAIANDTDYGLAAYVQSADPERIATVVRQLKAGQVRVNAASVDPLSPFGGYKQSGNGRENGGFGFDEYLETKAVVGYLPSPSAA
ncbi:aldehyde dehydrogenase family protein [Gryllotalpicola reticulitermitis]|uniref:Aldehyde dehydrogenase family protein n=1 Tax=Gryllotalpicola reticulitermitis TaxID=1184153 RepID=A0ABV8Q156_9MICO